MHAGWVSVSYTHLDVYKRQVLYCTQHALAMHERVSGAAVLCAETEREARAALEHLPLSLIHI